LPLLLQKLVVLPAGVVPGILADLLPEGAWFITEGGLPLEASAPGRPPVTERPFGGG